MPGWRILKVSAWRYSSGSNKLGSRAEGFAIWGPYRRSMRSSVFVLLFFVLFFVIIITICVSTVVIIMLVHISLSIYIYIYI